ncbi:MAG: S41 family peptidase [Bryobacterales bacterium]|nr:S41 family peptidase [Bryobacterales bacterium]MBV9400056.1 S41 family peptidase [Bryobacterales bacterium]
MLTRRLLPLLFACAALSGADPDPAQKLLPEVKKLIDVFNVVIGEAADPVEPDMAFYQGAIPGMLRTLDPHSSFFDPGQFQQLQQMERSEQKGFGSIVSVLPGRVIVLQALPGTPSAKAGLSAGDEIVGINNIALARLEFEQLIQLLSEARQHDVTLDVVRPGGMLMRIDMSPDLVNTPSVDRAFHVAPDVGYLRITGFEDPTGKLVRDTIEKLGGANLKGMILDLRNNPGGSVQAALEVAALFLKPDQVVFSARGRTAEDQVVRVPKLDKGYEFPLVVLVNARTASASEILSGALQDHDRALVFGEPTYGKGLVQQVFTLSGNSGLALTTAFYYTPSGRSIQKPLGEGQLGAATVVDKGPYKTDSGRIVNGGGGIQPDEVVFPEAQTRLRAVLDASGVLTSFSGEYIRDHEIPENFDVTAAVLDDFKVYCSAHSIQPSPAEWSSERPWIQSRLKQEIATLKFGVAKGDEIEMARDPVVQRGLARLTTAASR